MPLNDEAMAVLNEEKDKHPERVFTFAEMQELGAWKSELW